MPVTTAIFMVVSWAGADKKHGRRKRSSNGSMTEVLGQGAENGQQ